MPDVPCDRKRLLTIGAKEKRLDRALERTHREMGRVFLQNKTRNNVFIDNDFVHD